MNDRFKFRVWKKAENKMVEGVTYLNPLLLDEEIAPDKAKNYIIMQSTGLKDKNGKLIYEGDVVKVDVKVLGYIRERIGEVVYGYSFYPAFIIETTLGDVKDFTDDMEVIGNKFENPELLKECE